MLSSLSTKIELARFFFPDVTNDLDFGKDRPREYQELRNIVLDFLVFPHRLSNKDDAKKKYLHHAKALQKYLTSHVYEIVEPKEFLKETEKYTNKVFTTDVSFEDFLAKEPELIKKLLCKTSSKYGSSTYSRESATSPNAKPLEASLRTD